MSAALNLAEALAAEVVRTVALDVLHSDAAAELRRLNQSNKELVAALRRAALALAFAAESSPAMRDDYAAVTAAIEKATK